MKRAVITGATSGIGMAVCRRLLAAGWHVGIAARRADILEEIKASAPGRVQAMAIDVTDDDAPQRLHELIGRLGGMDLYFHASGIGKQNMTLDMDVENATVATNAMGFTRMVGAAYNYFAVHGAGHIAVVSSIAGVKGLGPAPSYSATKAFQNTYIQALEQQARTRRLDIAFTDIRPGFVATPLLGDGKDYPMLMDVTTVARHIVRAIDRRSHVCIIDWRYKLLVALWRLVPAWLWRRVEIHGAG